MKKWLIVFTVLFCIGLLGCNKPQDSAETTENQTTLTDEQKGTAGTTATEGTTPAETKPSSGGQSSSQTNTTAPTLPGHEHTFGAWSQAALATCQKEGTERRTCSTCHAEELRSTGKIAHKFSATKLACSVCRYVDTSSTAAVVELGNIANYEAGNMANYVWDVKIWNGKVYRGAGDYDANSGNTDFMVFNIAESKWEVAGTATDEAIHRYVEINGKLYAPGIDSRDSGGWNLGNYYVLENGKWVKVRNVPNGIHCFDMIGFGGKMYIGVGTETTEDTVAVSSDNGGSWSYLPLAAANGAAFDTSIYDWSRTYDFVEYNGTFYALMQFKLLKKDANGKDQYDMLIFRYDNGTMVYCCDNNFGSRVSRNYWQSAFEWKGTCYITARGLYAITDMGNLSTSTVKSVKLPGKELVSDAILYKNEMYVLAYMPSGSQYKVAIYKNSTGAADGYTLVASFDYVGIPYSFDFDGNYFYVGIGQVSANSPEKAGMLLRVKPNV